MFSLVSVLVLLATVFAHVAFAAGSVQEARSKLAELADTLRWHSTTRSTYLAVEPAARSAYTALVDAAKSGPRAIPQSSDFIERLGRLVSESHYMADWSRPKTYKQGFYDSDSLLTGALNEWSHNIRFIIANLEQPSGYRQPQLRSKVTGRGSGVSKSTKPGTEFRDCKDCPTMVVIPRGSFTAGTPVEELKLWKVEPNRWTNESPRRTIHISKPLSFGRTEVTVKQFNQFIKETNYKVRGGARWWDPEDRTAMVFKEELNWKNPGFPQTSDCPVTSITVEEARAYCRWLSVVTGQKYRLPSEEEWEFAARGGATTTFFWGDDPHTEQAYLYANTYDQTSQDANHFQWPATNGTDGFAYTAPVGSFRPNAFGLYDVIANAREFMDDTWVANQASSRNDGSVHRGVAPFPVVRGAAWDYTVRNLRLGYRDPYYSSEVATNMFGFRLVREL